MPTEMRIRLSGTTLCGPSTAFRCSIRLSTPPRDVAGRKSRVEDAIRLAISLGGDADTQGCIAGGIAQGFYGEVPEEIVAGVRARLPAEFLEIIDAFEERFP